MSQSNEEQQVSITVSDARSSAKSIEQTELACAYDALAQTEARLRELEQRLRQSQKLEAVGALASGVAHDFNNVLTGIIGCADLALLAVGAGSPAAHHIEELKSAARAGAGIVSQLMDLGRKRATRVRVLDLNALLTRRESFLRCLLGEDVELELLLTATPAPVRCDPDELEQVVMNLVVNARQAMPDGGRLTIATSELEIDDARTHADSPLGPGRYVMLEVSDTGVGMDQATRQHLFERFFTTKEPDQGTGLGLSTVSAIVTSCGGDISVQSEPGRGAIFTLRFPWCAERIESDLPPVAAKRGNGETVLIVDDEPLVRLTVRNYLERGGYRVIEATDGRAAQQLLRKLDVVIDLLLTDVVLPDESGPTLAAEGTTHRPSLPVVYMSAYPSAALAQRQQIAADAITVQKPFEQEQLLSAVHQAIASSSEAS